MVVALDCADGRPEVYDLFLEGYAAASGELISVFDLLPIEVRAEVLAIVKRKWADLEWEDAA